MTKSGSTCVKNQSPQTNLEPRFKRPFLSTDKPWMRLGLLLTLFTLGTPQAFAQYFEHLDVAREQVFLSPFADPALTKDEAIQSWAFVRNDQQNQNRKTIPPETGRAFLIPGVEDKHGPILVKGTGTNPEFTEVANTIRYAVTPGEVMTFDGKFKTREATIDFVNSEILAALGIPVARPLGWISLGYDPTLHADRALYAREFVSQTRISNAVYLCEKINPQEAMKEIDRVISILNERRQRIAPLKRVSYFFFLLDQLAKTTATLQRLGFQHGYFHSQQFTLAGEISDLGTGTWESFPEFNSWSRTTEQQQLGIRSQPLLALNALFRTHALSTENPEPLAPDAETLKEHRKSLFSVFMKGDPVSAREILAHDPEAFYWERFNTYYQTIDAEQTLSLFRPQDWVKPFNDENRAGEIRLVMTAEEMIGTKKKIGLIGKRKIERLAARNYVPANLRSEASLAPASRNPELEKKLEFPAEAWGLIIQDDPGLVAFTKEFEGFLDEVQTQYGDLAIPDALLAVRLGIFSRVQIGKTYSLDPSAMNKYKAWDRSRYLSPKPASELLSWGVGECHDTALLATILGKVLEKKDPRFTSRIVDANFNPTMHHYYSVLSFGKESWVIESVDSSWRGQSHWIGPLSAFTEDWSPLHSSIHTPISKILVLKPKGSSHILSQCRRFLTDWVSQMRDLLAF